MRVYTAKGVVKDSTPEPQLTAFDVPLSAEYTPVIELKSNYGVSALRDITTETNSGTVTHSGAEYILTTGTTASSVARLVSAERGRYQPGAQCMTGIGFRRPTAPTGAQEWKAGYYDTEDGFGFGEDATGVYVFYRKASSDTKVYQTAWNQDKMDGTGRSGLTVDLTPGVIFQMPFTWYGYGSLRFAILYQDANGKDKYVEVHTVNPTGISVNDPNLPIAAEVINGATEVTFITYIAGRQFSVAGRYNPNRRITSVARLAMGSVGETALPLATFRRKSAFDSVSVKVEGFDVLSTADMLIQVILNGTLAGSPSYGALTGIAAAETAVEVDVAASGVSGGVIIYQALIDSATGKATALAGVEALGLDIPALQPVTIAVRTVSGTGATASAVFRVEEEW